MQFSIVFYKWILGLEETLNFEDLIHVDVNLYEQFKKLQSIVNMRNKLLSENDLLNQQSLNKSNIKKSSKFKDDTQIENLSNMNHIDENDERLLFDGCKISDLSLIFTLPGYSNIELKKGGKDCLVTLENLDQYVNVRLLRYLFIKLKSFIFLSWLSIGLWSKVFDVNLNHSVMDLIPYFLFNI